MLAAPRAHLQSSDSAGLGWGPLICISKKFPGTSTLRVLMESVVVKSTDYGVRDPSVPQHSCLQNGDEQRAPASCGLSGRPETVRGEHNHSARAAENIP